MQCNAILWYFMLCYVVLCYVMLYSLEMLEILNIFLSYLSLSQSVNIRHFKGTSIKITEIWRKQSTNY